MHHRRSIRLRGYNYATCGCYFVTVVINDRTHRLGEVVNDEMILNDAGKMVDSVWNHLPERFPTITLDEYQIMPDHFHGIVVLGDDYDSRVPTRGTPTLGDIIDVFKSVTTNRYINGVKMGLVPHFTKRFWQRNYWEHIIRNELELNAIRLYIQQNPILCETDHLSENELRIFH